MHKSGSIIESLRYVAQRCDFSPEVKKDLQDWVKEHWTANAEKRLSELFSQGMEEEMATELAHRYADACFEEHLAEVAKQLQDTLK